MSARLADGRERAVSAGWAPYGDGLAYMKRGCSSIYLWRRGQRCRWFTAAGEQVGPEQANVAPAIAWALGQGYSSGWLAKATRVTRKLRGRRVLR